MNLLKDLQAERGISYLLIAHNLATVRYLAHRVGVMYLGRIVEHGEPEAVFREPLHPYTKALIAAAAPRRTSDAAARLPIWGEVPSPVAPSSGCRFHPRCPVAMERCAVEPALRATDGRRTIRESRGQGPEPRPG